MSNILDEIPYIVKARKDTGLFNSKIAIWLFLASEVMLFGGLFSGYIFLRIYADYPWPERALPIMPGFINTFVLIGSSVTVVFAWAALKMRKYFQFQVYMGITLLCAVGFMVLKTIEYKAKFAHQAVRMEETHAVAEGHFPEIDPANHTYYENVINYSASSFAFDLSRYHTPFLEQILEAAGEGTKITLTEKSVQSFDLAAKAFGVEMDPVLTTETELTTDVLEDLRSKFLDLKEKRSNLRIAALREAWANVRTEWAGRGLSDRELATKLDVNSDAVTDNSETPIQIVEFVASQPISLSFKPSMIQASGENARLKDGTGLKGEELDSTLLLAVDTLDFRQTARRAEERNLDPIAAIDNSWLVSENPEIAEIWERHKEETEKLRKELIERGGYDENGEPKLVPNENDLYRITWQEIVYYGGAEEEEPGVFAGFAGPDHYNEAYAAAFPDIEIPRELIGFQSNLTPKWNTYYALYFLMTGLHGLHVIGGALVLGYFGFCSGKMYREHPEWLANRVEVGGLFWHFVDLVWIFLFPIMYLM